MSLDKSLKKVLILGSGPIIIGQAAEFDYSGTQACKSIKEEGIETVLVNSNPATIMTDLNIADKVYIEPLKVEVIERIIEKEKPSGILAGFGGQTALNIAMELQNKGVLKKHNVKLLGINADTIKKAEDREEFKKLMIEIKEPVPESAIATNMDQCREFVKKHGLPIIIRPAYTLGGTGGGIAENMEQYLEICELGLNMSPIHQILLEQSVAGWKELEYEVIRDKKDNCIIICNMENIDPVGVHTGDSIVVAPSQTLTDKQYHMLRNSALKIIRSLKIEGGCNIQFALDPLSDRYIVIEVNPRVSRSSALASKAAGYPIAKIASKIAIGYSLDELKNYVTQTSSACFEPALDYVVVKMPKWPFDKFSTAERKLGTQMKATGEVMAIDRNFESAFLKAITCLEGKIIGLKLANGDELSDEEVIDKIKMQDDERIFAIGEALRRGVSIDYIYELTKIDKWFLNKINNIIKIEKRLESKHVDNELICEASILGFTDEQISKLSNIDVEKIEIVKKLKDIYPVYKMVDTCSGEFEAKTPYYYSCYDKEDENTVSDREKIMVIGSGPIRIGQGIEFDYCCVHGAWAINEAGYESIMINNNPETVSTDFDTSDKLYFESLYIDDVMNVIRKENPKGVILQFGGQTSINLAEKLSKKGVNILGTQFESIDLAEDRDKFRKLLESLDIKTPTGRAVNNIEEAFHVVEKLGYPVIVRPSYVIGGRAMEVIYDKIALEKYMNEAVSLENGHTIIVDKYVKGIEIEVDAIADGEDILIPGIMEHVERTGVHSGDSITVYPPMTLKEETIEKLVENTKKIAKALKTVGLINIQYVFDGKDIYVIEVNPRASRTVPILSKVTGVPMINIAVKIMLGEKLKDMCYGTGLKKENFLHAVKVPVFSNEKLADVDIYLGPEMKSTGEVLGIDYDLDKAIYKGLLGAGIKIETEGAIYVSLKDVDKIEGADIIKEYYDLGFKVYSSEGTGKILKQNNIECEVIDTEKLFDLINKKKIQFIINTPTKGNNSDTEGFKIRRKSAEYRVPIFTCIDTAKICLRAIKLVKQNEKIEYRALNKYFAS
ncbi:carbamoyl-phosphate synthase (glutamine-hydrolyzing) large subunit [Clostridium thermopalmarium]|uniref:Carbamoyl phosphate synthase large chain n=1 Tax=Clostridium thermopalmarium DSM 5974 TaxID=1121340 RepID=A0A2T0APU6_9CLOT|nr:carbamoyl-phosphate synthase (glutamine-hydrolyzing) large subunit [Clostridium thermopalmarium]MBE6042945.1 carbamoyl-phosphate synthase (glutamine-hydrolyzing) large subunit [Clostridium thermopalmarium]PRR71036.1 Carbamoyl-phosphate synthase large chain [Clostridium thermopalmarium DSM 5974]PVZ23625.1 carbamoyl-phosphate synthase large subunit [Clostridium thermopalmarium DSM 5974]